jgi:uncharacterized protein (DUF58 family)
VSAPQPATPRPGDPSWQDPEPPRRLRLVSLVGPLLTLVGVLTRNVWLVILGAGMMSATAISFEMRPRFNKLTFCYDVPRRAVVGEPAALMLHVHNTSRRSQPALRVSTRIDGFAPASMWVDPLAGGAVGEIRSTQLPLRRGEFGWFWIRLESRAPFGLLNRRTVLAFATREPALVHPRRVPPADHEDLGGDGEQATGVRDRDGSQMWALRDYRPGDPVRRVHWRSTARRGELVVVEPERAVSMRRTVLVVGGQDGTPEWEESLARAAWTVAELLGRGGVATLHCAAPGRPPLVTAEPLAALDWFAALRPWPLPDPGQLLDRLRGAGDVQVIASPDVPAGWWAMARGVAARAGCRLSAASA